MAKKESQKNKNIKDIKQPSRLKKAIEVVFLSIVIFALLLGSAFVGFEKVYAGKIIPGVKIADYNAGGQSKEGIKGLVENHIKELESQKLNIVINDNVLNPTAGDLGISFDGEKTLEKAYEVGRNKSVPDRFMEIIETVIFSKDITVEPKIDEGKLNEYVSKNSDLNREAKNATLKVEEGKVIIVLSENGSKIDVDEFKSDLNKNLNDNRIDNPIKAKSILVNPEIDENQVALLRPIVEKLISQPLIIAYNYREYTADSDMIAGWIIIKKDNGQVKVDFSNDKVREFTDYIASKIDRKAIDKKINIDTGAVIEEGRDGNEVNQDKLLADIKLALEDRITNSGEIAVNPIIAEVELKERKEIKVKPEEIPQGGGTPGLYAGRYLEVNLSEQRLYAYDGESLAGAYTVSTGKWSMPTPIGTRYIESKADRAYSSKYNLYMPYWNSIGGGYGIHELPEWSGGYKEGESHLGTPVSHGCIRLGVGPAEFVYNWAPVGTPVYIHK